MNQEKFCVKRKKQGISSREELLQLKKEELVDRLLRLEAHNVQLKNIISKTNGSDKPSGKESGGRPFDFSKCHTRRILLRILYLGWDFQGLATQEDTTRTIEHELFRALTMTQLVESREKAGYHRCGRTDKGVSSFGQVLSLTIRSKLPPEQRNEEGSSQNELQYCKMLNRLLPAEIRALCWQPIPEDRPEFSARFDCKQRSYRYYFPRGDLNMAAVSLACRHLVGAHDFRNLCKMDVANGVTRFERNVRECRIVPVQRDSEDATSMYCLRISGDAFLWHQIRCIVGVLLLIGQGREQPDVVKELLDVDKNPRKPQYSMGLHLPLNLYSCEYDLNTWLWDEEELASVITCLQAEWTKYSVKSTMINDCLQSLEMQYNILKGNGETINSDNKICEIKTIDKHGRTCEAGTEENDGKRCETRIIGKDRQRCESKTTDSDGQRYDTKTIDNGGEKCESKTIDKDGQTYETETADKDGDRCETRIIDNDGQRCEIKTREKDGDRCETKTIDKDGQRCEIKTVDKDSQTYKTVGKDGDRCERRIIDNNGQKCEIKITDKDGQRCEIKTLDRDGDRCETRTIDNNGQRCAIRRHADCLLDGIKSKVYKPLMQREKCSSLAERIEHYTKKRRIERVMGTDE